MFLLCERWYRGKAPWANVGVPPVSWGIQLSLDFCSATSCSLYAARAPAIVFIFQARKEEEQREKKKKRN